MLQGVCPPEDSNGLEGMGNDACRFHSAFVYLRGSGLWPQFLAAEELQSGTDLGRLVCADAKFLAKYQTSESACKQAIREVECSAANYRRHWLGARPMHPCAHAGWAPHMRKP